VPVAGDEAGADDAADELWTLMLRRAVNSRLMGRLMSCVMPCRAVLCCALFLLLPATLLLPTADEACDDDDELMDLDADGGTEPEADDDELFDEEMCDEGVATGSKRKRNSSKVRRGHAVAAVTATAHDL
jgi:hypothetical protein